ncbi:MAG: colanic acid biosynthesis glycosyltransferase WcaI [Verrucomicrobia bacterium]|nr:MAG: colanic acid biosynthesis glycosyltransferase WcaI [Verrucomicrobiota bacterium]
MRVIVWGINYAPEITGIAPHNVALCEFLQRHGHDVELVTTFAYYPAWRKRPEDRHLFCRTDRINDVPVHRCWHFVPQRLSAWKRIVHEATFVLTSTMRILLLRRPDVYVVVSPPLLLGAAGWLVATLKRAPFIFHVQDLQPDAAIGLGMLRTGLFTCALYWLEAFVYKHATRVSGISGEIVDAFRGKGVPDRKLILFPNAVVLPADTDILVRGKFRAKHHFAADDFLAVYAGNLGVKQGLEILLDAADLLRAEKKIRIVIAGDGAAREKIAKGIRDRNNISMLPLQYGTDYKELLVDADISLITQQGGSGNAFFPSKLLITLAYSSPVVTVADEESALARAVANGQCGKNILPGHAEQLANCLRKLSEDRQQLRHWGANGRAYVEQFEQRRVLEKFFGDLKSLGEKTQ